MSLSAIGCVRRCLRILYDKHETKNSHLVVPQKQINYKLKPCTAISHLN
uniref:Uncharacterized protein n=1 Tax=Anguilla anguilla TaxID=7936 RepID=A0A0E9XMU8_ANGAN